MFDPATFFEMEESPAVYHHTLWCEKYRPKQFADFIGSESVKNTFKLWLDKKDIPHLLLYGSPGTGKTSLGKMIVDTVPCDHMIINASDENGVDAIRNKIQDFCMTMGMHHLKILFLDEADRITVEGQAIMRNLMETYSHSTRFILTCNYPEKISSAIKSRCQSFEIKPPSKADVMKHLVNILTKENIKYSLPDVAFIIKSYFPDMRKIINFAQQSSVGNELKIASANTLDQDYKSKLIELLKTPDSPDVFTQIRQLISDASFSNYEEVYKHLFDRVDEYSNHKSAEVILSIAESSYQSAIVFEREITFVAAMHKLLTILKK
jgi:replication factor C small subunit